MNSLPGSITINGTYYPKEALIALSDTLLLPGKQDWEQSLGGFFRQWLNDSDSILVSTSGSTGSPKTIAIPKTSMLMSASMTGRYFSFEEGQTTLLCLNTAYIAGMMMVVRAMLFRMNLITVYPGRSPLDTPAEGRIDFCAMVPAQVFHSLQNPLAKGRLESIGTLIIGGAPIGPELERMIEPLGGNIYATFGMTETITHIALRRLNGPDKTDAYSALPGIAIGSNEAGCLVARVPWDKTHELCSNDLVSIVSPGTFRWLGRADHIINTGGLKLIPETIEKKIAALIKYRFFIAGLPDAGLGEIPALILESADPLPGEEIEAILASIRPMLAKAETPSKIIRAIRFIETGNGKINRKESLKNIPSG